MTYISMQSTYPRNLKRIVSKRKRSKIFYWILFYQNFSLNYNFTLPKSVRGYRRHRSRFATHGCILQLRNFSKEWDTLRERNFTFHSLIDAFIDSFVRVFLPPPRAFAQVPFRELISPIKRPFRTGSVNRGRDFRRIVVRFNEPLLLFARMEWF